MREGYIDGEGLGRGRRGCSKWCIGSIVGGDSLREVSPLLYGGVWGVDALEEVHAYGGWRCNAIDSFFL